MATAAISDARTARPEEILDSKQTTWVGGVQLG
jgi:hypothetical protein